jgi:tRNA-Thr(GGU) m(6)t(6)A37 methyltransferase TsaA
MMSWIVNPIGVVHSPIREVRDENWGGVESDIELFSPYVRGLEGLEEFSHLRVVFWLHQADFDPERDLIRRPQGRADMPDTGIFAQRAKHRPNPIGITAVSIVEVGENRVRVRGLDAIDGTPVLDLKPYVPAFDQVEGVRTPDWLNRLMEAYF